jgi:alpha-galactosidase
MSQVDCAAARLLLLACLHMPGAALASNNGRAMTPPRGWRSWNQFQCRANQSTMLEAIRGLTDESRTCSDGTPCSLASLGFVDVGLDDCWQLCGKYGPENNTYHDEHGAPVIDTSKFPDMAAWVDAAHAKGLTAGWYHNNCRCNDHCTSPVCFAGDVNATIALGFDSIKLDGCGAEEDVELWAELFNHSLRERGGTGGGQPGIMIENCHNGQFLKGKAGHASSWPRHNGTSKNGGGAGYRLTNLPYFDKHEELICPYHLYRSSTDILPHFGSILVNLNTIPALADAHLSQPGCWACAFAVHSLSLSSLLH